MQSVRQRGDIEAATKHLAQLHSLLCCPRMPAESDICGSRDERMDLALRLGRHMREMKRIYNYIRGKKQRNEMELRILKLFQRYYDQAGFANMYMEEIAYPSLLRESVGEGRIYHGSYNYHNILFREKRIVTTNFDKTEFGIQIVDLYGFLRKIMEKNNWDTEQGMKLLDVYCSVRSLDKREAKLLYVLLLFPEKFWKQMNFYYNGKKTWMSGKNYDKLLKLESQEQARRNFLKHAKTLLF